MAKLSTSGCQISTSTIRSIALTVERAGQGVVCTPQAQSKLRAMWGKKRTPPPPEWVCPQCGGTHVGLPTDYGWRLPDDVWALGEEARQAHLDWATDVCHHEGRWFLRGVLYVPFTFSDGRWGWGCWAEVQESTVHALWALEDRDGSHLPPEPGTLACEIPCYPDSMGLPVRVQFGPGHLRPFFYCAEDQTHPLATDQRHGIDEAKYHAIVDTVMPK